MAETNLVEPTPETDLPENLGEALDEGTDQPNLERLKQNIQDIQKPFQKTPTDEAKTSSPAPSNQESKTAGDGPATTSTNHPTPPTSNASAGAKTPAPSPKEGGSKLTGQALEQFKAGKAKLAAAGKKAGEVSNAAAAAKDIKDHAGEYAKEIAKEKAKQAAKKVAKQAAQAAKQVVKQLAEKAVVFLMDNPITLTIIGVILFIFLLIGLLFFAFSFGRQVGGGPPIYPKTAAERYQVTKLSALSGSNLANTQLVQQTVAAEKLRFQKVQKVIAKAYPNDAAKQAAAKTALGAIVTELDNVLKAPDLASRQAAVNQIESDLQSFVHTYPEVLGVGAVNGGYLTVPGVQEAAGGDCGAASILMVARYYKSDLQDNDTYDSVNRASRRSVCVNPEYLNSHSPYKDWRYASSQNTSLENVKKSLAGGDPVIIYTTPGAVYSIQHIFVIVGYDPSDHTFFVNNPFPGGVNLHTKNPNNRQMTEDNLSHHFGDSIYDHAFIIRGKYL